MSYQEDWLAISCRIKSLIQAGQFHLQSRLPRDIDTNGARAFLLKQSFDVYGELKSYFRRFERTTPTQVSNVLGRFINDYYSMFNPETEGDAGIKYNRLSASVTIFAALEGELTFLLSDRQENIRRRSELAFTHLQRLIIADPDVQQKWKNAFEKGETACEKLGAIHLLHHGIWAFKAHAEGARTDLIYGELMDSIEEVERTSNGLVLTEWKLAQKKSVGAAMFKCAREQASRYACGMLAGIELSNYRFAVVVSEQSINAPPDIQLDGVIYRHVNIAVNPLTPSKCRMTQRNLPNSPESGKS